ncbi:MAG TPA: hypothetical protein VI451_08250 [Anaerolineales bacterium]|nr:hypothetical protein [Anaerolineales bacterium]
METEPSTPLSNEPADPVKMTLRLREGTRVQVTVELLDESGRPGQTATVTLSAPTGKNEYEETIVFRDSAAPLQMKKGSKPEIHRIMDAQALREKTGSLLERTRQKIQAYGWTLPNILFVMGLVIYLVVRLIGLSDYPIYFFSDEALPTVYASDLLRDNFVSEGDTLLPTYFRNGRKFSLGATVYLNIIPFLIFGKSVQVVRGTTVLVTLLAAAGIGLMMKQVFERPNWWVGPLLLSLVPAWFLHSRTGFETAVASSFYAAFLYFYFLYRTRAPRYLYHAVIFGALTFYSYAPGQLVMVMTGVGLILSDLQYHWENRQVGMRGVALLLLFAVPYVRFQLTHPGAFEENLRESSSYLVGNYTSLEKFQRFLKEYITGLSPLYWYFPNNVDIPRHTMNGYGNILWIMLPFALIGLVEALKSVRASPHSPVWRALLIGLAASPAGAAVAGLGVTRVLFFVIPATLLTGLGFDKGIAWGQAYLQRKGKKFSPQNLAWSVFGILAVGCIVQSADALINGPIWHTDYGMSGMQYGARQVFSEIEAVLQTQPETSIHLSPDWANGVVELARFFLGDPLPVTLESLQRYSLELRALDPNVLFVMSFREYLEAGESRKFNLHVERTIYDPNGHPAYLFAHAEYVSNVDEIFAEEAEARRVLLDGSTYFEGYPIPVRYSKLDIGDISNVFDGNDETVIRTAEANPLVVEFFLPETRQVNGLELIIGATKVQITVQLFPEFGAEPVVFNQELEGFLESPNVVMEFGEAVPALVIRVEIKDLHQSEPGHVHLWEIRLR